MTSHTLSVLVENKPGVLVRIAGLFARRNFNIDSLAVGPTEHEEISRITIVVNCEEHPLEQVTKQLNKLINVLKIVELEPGEVDKAIERAMAIDDRPVVVDFVVHKDAMVWPMVAAGTSNNDIKFARGLAPDWGGSSE